MSHKYNQFIISSLIGAVLGLLISFSKIHGSWLDLVLWGIVGLGIGIGSTSRKEAVWNGAFYGFFLCLLFLIAGHKTDYNGIHASYIPLMIVLSIFGSVCGSVLGLIGNLFRI